MNALYILAIFLPLIGALIAGLGNRKLGDRGAQLVTSGGLILAALISCLAFVEVALGHNPRSIELFRWIDSGSFEAAWSLRFDTLSVVMMCVVTIVSACVHVYSIGYMSHDHSKPRFMAYLSLFTFAMLMLVTADNLVQMFFGWEGVGVCSYLLIGFWYDRPSANAAAMKAFVVNRVGDFGFALGIFGVFLLFDTVAFDAIFGAAAQFTDARIHFLGMNMDALEVLCFLLFIG
ncbi:MAG: proton-conducting transporter membrane subunit, partial [Rhodospirillales bacterium]